MPRGIPISEAVSLAMHSMAYIASKEHLASVHEISDRLAVSEFHLSKVLQRLTKSGLLTSTRGPQGGFTLATGGDSLTLLDVFEAIEGPLKKHACLMRKKTCAKKSCILGDSINTMWNIFHKHLSSTRISDIADTYRREARI
jgi:Rrf2 family transcriptional regulator, nitric oxide-sensitive transcriptional repressor